MVKKLFITLANLSGICGIVFCGVSGVARAAGSYYLFGYENMTVFNAGIGMMVLCILIKQEILLWASH
ncbi:hypothetical protein KOI40_13665 [Aestuariicella sp. G3-2]|uniref:hypothetical protein n=1 Tax=Pseudomaricurvus albidus TaxID=2842452 RepID=UPI001C0B5CAE|nr:hypothetical protein [Aestuariicella albida]MBU3070869.1 hypothetical protein [Aestuariicella albida]